VNQKFFEIKYVSESNTVNNMKLVIIAKIRVIHSDCFYVIRCFRLWRAARTKN